MSLYIRCEEDTNFQYEFYHDNCEALTAVFSRQYHKNGKCICCSFQIPSILLLDETNNYRTPPESRNFYNRGAHYPISLNEADKYKLKKIS